MEYTPSAAKPFIGKRVVVSLRERAADGRETFSGFWGIIDSAQQHGIVLRIEGGDIEGFWIMPPELDALEPAEAEVYHFREHETPVRDVDYVAKFLVTDSINQLPLDAPQA